jgi:hypothetical protein
MPDRHAYRGALEAVDRILNRGGDHVLEEVVRVLHERAGFDSVGILPGPSAGPSTGGGQSIPVTYEGRRVAELRVDPPADPEGRAFLERVAVLISAHCANPRT